MAGDGVIDQSSQALEAFLSSANAISAMSASASALDVALAIVEASTGIADAATAADVYDALLGDSDRSVLLAALAGETVSGRATTLGGIIASIYAGETGVLTASADVSTLDPATGADVYDSTLADLERSISEGAQATESAHGGAAAFASLVNAVSASVASNARVASIVGVIAGAIASSSSTTADVEDARLQKLIVASISITKAITSTLSSSKLITGTVSLN